MPHYIAAPARNSRKYYIFSTVVMAPVTSKMYRAEMLEWLKSHEGYEGFYDPRPYDVQFPDYYGESKNCPGGYQAKEIEMTYWNGSFWFVTEEDNYFV